MEIGKNVGINIYGVEEGLTDVNINENWYCRYVQVGTENANGGFTGIIWDYQGGGISDGSYFVNGKEIKPEIDVDAIDVDVEDILSEKLSDEQIREFMEPFNEFFEGHPEHVGFLILKKEKRAYFTDLFKQEGNSNIFFLKGHKILNPREMSCGMTSFS